LMPGKAFGFGVRKVVLDLSDDSTPLDILSQFGLGEDWKGVYLPDVRVFVDPPGMDGWVFDASAHNLLIGLADTPGVSGEFEIDAVHSELPMRVEPRFFGKDGKEYAVVYPPIKEADVTASGSVYMPKDTYLVLDISRGSPPYPNDKMTVTG